MLPRELSYESPVEVGAVLGSSDVRWFLRRSRASGPPPKTTGASSTLLPPSPPPDHPPTCRVPAYWYPVGGHYVSL
jgi:hypothetical protein